MTTAFRRRCKACQEWFVTVRSSGRKFCAPACRKLHARLREKNTAPGRSRYSVGPDPAGPAWAALKKERMDGYAAAAARGEPLFPTRRR